MPVATPTETETNTQAGDVSAGSVAADSSSCITAVDCCDIPEFDGHELVFSCKNSENGLRAFVAIHTTTLGPALGGCRMWPYDSEEAALSDALRLSQGMSYKHAVAGTHQGGGKAVIIGDPRRDKTDALLQSFGRFVDRLAGR